MEFASSRKPSSTDLSEAFSKSEDVPIATDTAPWPSTSHALREARCFSVTHWRRFSPLTSENPQPSSLSLTSRDSRGNQRAPPPPNPMCRRRVCAVFALLTQIICSLAPGTGCRDRAPRVAQPSAQASQPLSGSALRRARSEGGGPEAGSAGETPGCPRVGRVRRVWGAAACPSAQDTPLPRALRPCPRGQARAGDLGSASSRSRSGKRAPGPLSVTSRSSLHPHLHWEPRCVYVLMSCASIRWQLSRGCFPSGTEL